MGRAVETDPTIVCYYERELVWLRWAAPFTGSLTLQTNHTAKDSAVDDDFDDIKGTEYSNH